MREREQKEGRVFFFGCDYDVSFVPFFFFFFFFFFLLFVVVVVVCLVERAKGQKSDSRWRR